MTLDLGPRHGIAARRRLGFEDDIQWAFYSGYFVAHEIKVQAITLPNSMIRFLRVSDSGLLKMSNQNGYLVEIFHQHNISLPGDLCPCVYGGWNLPSVGDYSTALQ